MRAYLASLASLLTLGACSGAEQEPRTEATGAGQASAEPRERHSANVPVTAGADRSARSRAMEALSIKTLPLRDGVYTRSGSGSGQAVSCPPTLASLAIFDGEGFGGRNSTGCRFNPALKNGSTWSGSQTCTDTYTNQQRTEDLAIAVHSATRYTQYNQYGTQTFELCPNEDLSDWDK